MTENETITVAHRFMREAVEERGGLCACGAHSERPCWRPAAELRWHSDPEPTICAEHGRLFSLEEEVEGSLEDLDSMHGWIAQLGAQFRRGEDRSHLDHRLRGAFDELLAEYFGLALRLRAAELIAGQGEGEEPLEPEEAEELARNIMVSDALLNAGLFIEEAAPEVYAEAQRAKALAFENSERAVHRAGWDAETVIELVRAADDLLAVLDVLDRAEEHARRAEEFLSEEGAD